MAERPEDHTNPLIHAAAVQALQLVSVTLPHLSGLARHVRVEVDERVASAGIFASGRLLVNPLWFQRLNRSEQAFVMAHELMHLALQTHARAEGSDARLFNIAHDYIINDMLTEAFGGMVLAGGLAWRGARQYAAEEIVHALQTRLKDGDRLPDAVWRQEEPREETPSAMEAALRKAGLVEDPIPQQHASAEVTHDVLDDALERSWFPGDTAIGRQQEVVVREAAKALALEQLWDELNTQHMGGIGVGPGRRAAMVKALETMYRPPWEQALQGWMDAVAPMTRSYMRPSRRGTAFQDVVLPGRKREGWTLHIVLDTSGSMTRVQSYVLGAIAQFCKGVNVDRVHVLQCDTEVAREEYITPEELAQFEVVGFGGSDMSPALLHLAADPYVEAAVVITDGMIAYPDHSMPYAVLWTLTHPDTGFEPPYGQIIRVPPTPFRASGRGTG